MADRADLKDFPSVGRLRFLAILEIADFRDLLSTVGYGTASKLMQMVEDRLGEGMGVPDFARIGPGVLEFTFSSDAERATERLSRCVSQLASGVIADGIHFRLRACAAYTKLVSGVADAKIVDALFAELCHPARSAYPVIYASIDQLDDSRAGDIEILRALPAALSSDELELHYQPKLNCRAQSFQSAEALLRWNSAGLGAVSTERAVKLAERSGLIHELTLWTLRRAVRDQQHLRQRGHDIVLFVNLSGALVTDRDFLAQVLLLIGPLHGAVGLEITETATIENPGAAIENLHSLSKAKVPISIDDFGSGAASLAYLKHLPAQELKIDRQFIGELTRSNRDPLIVRAAIDLAHAMEMRVTAEGVDDAICLSLLTVMGCDMAQGYMICPPVPLDGLVRFLDQEQPAERTTPVTAMRST